MEPWFNFINDPQTNKDMMKLLPVEQSEKLTFSLKNHYRDDKFIFPAKGLE